MIPAGIPARVPHQQILSHFIIEFLELQMLFLPCKPQFSRPLHQGKKKRQPKLPFLEKVFLLWGVAKTI